MTLDRSALWAIAASFEELRGKTGHAAKRAVPQSKVSGPTSLQSDIDTIAALAFMAGAELDFAFVRVLAFGGLTKHLDRERDQAMLLGSFHFFSVRLAIGATALVAYYVQSFPAWLLAAFLSTTIYLLVLGASPQQPTHGTTGRMVERTDLAT